MNMKRIECEGVGDNDGFFEISAAHASSCKSDLLCVGDLVEPVSSKYQLASGCCYYDFAVVVSIEPFVLVSECSDMKWSHTVKPENFKSFGTAKPEILERCSRRLYT